MSEEPAFTNIRVTLSDEAMTILDNFKEEGRFRSNSATVEEVLRAAHRIIPITKTVNEAISTMQQIPPETAIRWLNSISTVFYRLSPVQ